MAADTSYLSAVIGAANAPEVAFLNEDDSPPLVSSNARICLVHGVQGLENTKLTLTINLAPIDAAVAFGQASQSVNTLFMLGGSANPFGDVIMDR
ncbi:MAG TPA: hypothetical protein VFL86_10275 [Burkholderiaceae bacterium]|nr:hypothetical protein [Burkholderiaceae bacterium]